MIVDYNIYRFSKKEYVQYAFIWLIMCLFIAYLFYSNFILSILLIPLFPIFILDVKKKIIARRKWQLNTEFKDGLLSVSSALNAGYSLENAFIHASEDLKLIYSDNSLIITEFKNIVLRMQMNFTVESILEDLGKRSGVEDIANFSEVIKTAKRTGGDLIHVIQTTSKIISDKLEVKREIITLITAKKLEAKIMNLIPFGIVLYLRIFSPEFLTPLYHNVFGILFMSIVLICIYGVSQISNKIMDIHV
ncbi:MAG: type II secretion system F family protein [Anaerocolumna sp.]